MFTSPPVILIWPGVHLLSASILYFVEVFSNPEGLGPSAPYAEVDEANAHTFPARLVQNEVV